MQVKEYLTLKNEQVPFVLKKSKRARYIRLHISQTGTLVGTLPYRMHEFYLRRFIWEKADWIVKKRRELLSRPLPLALDPTGEQYKALKDGVKRLLEARVKYFNTFYNFAYSGIHVRNQRSIWGSCTSNKTLNFNYRIAFIPPHLQDYIVVHELCHVKHMNHARSFWQEVGKTLPHYKQLRKKLKEYRLSLG